MRIGAMLKRWRENKGLTYYRVAQDSGIDADYIKRIEESTSENEPNIKMDTLDRLAKALGVPASDLVNNNEEIMHLTDRERDLIFAFRRFDEGQQDICVSFLNSMSKQ